MKTNTFIQFLIYAIVIAALGFSPIMARANLNGNTESKSINTFPPISVMVVLESMDSTFYLNDPTKIKDVFNLAKSAYYLNDYNTSIALHQRFISLINSKDSQNCYFSELLTSYSQLADAFFRKNDFNNSIYYNKLAVKLLWRESLLLENYWFYFYRIGQSYYSLSDFSNSLIYYLESEKLHKQRLNSEYNEETAVIKNNIGLCYLKLGLKEESIRNFNEANIMYDNLKEPKEKGKIEPVQIFV